MKAKPYTKWILAAAILGGLWLAWNAAYPSGSFNYRMTITLDTPEGIKTASTVRKICYSSEPDILPEQHPIHHGVCQGEAIGIDLGKDGMLFALMIGENNDDDHAHMAVFATFPKMENTSIGTKKELAQKWYPKFVRFRDINDFTTTERVNFDKWPPYADQGIYGGKIKLLKIEIEITSDPVEWHIFPYVQKLFGKDSKYRLWLEAIKYGDPLRQGKESYIRGIR